MVDAQVARGVPYLKSLLINGRVFEVGILRRFDVAGAAGLFSHVISLPS